MNPISKCSDMISAGFNVALKPLSPIPTFLTTVEKRFRSGLSPKLLTAQVINELGNAGFNIEKLPNGQDNQLRIMVKIICEQIVKHIQDNASVEASIDSLGTTIISEGGNAGGPIITHGTNYLPIMARGYVR